MVSKSSDDNIEATRRQSDQRFRSADELVAYSQGVFAADFPNPERLGCPVPGALRGLIRSRQALDNNLRSHLFGCSECFSEYRNALMALRDAENVSANREARIPFFVALWRKPVRAYAGAFALIILALAATYVWRGYRLRQDLIVTQGKRQIIQQPENLALVKLSPATTSPTPVRPFDEITRPEPKQSTQEKALVAQTRAGRELIAMSIDLGNYAVTRGGAVSRGAIEIPRVRVRLMLRLPEGSGSGLYSVSVTGASGDTLQTINARSHQGKSLIVILDLQRLAPEHYRMRISRQGEPPIEVPIAIGPVKKRWAHAQNEK